MSLARARSAAGPRTSPARSKLQNTFESLHAHVKLDGGVVIHPGDEVLVHGDPVAVPFGETRVASSPRHHPPRRSARACCGRG